MKILIVSSFLPYPLFTGGHIRLYNIIKELSKRHKVILVCEKREFQGEKDILEVEKICSQLITVEREKQWSLKNILKTGFSKYPFLMVGHTNPQMREKIKSLLEREKFDLIHVETFYVMQNLPDPSIDGLPIVLVEHNIEHLVYKRYVKTTPVLLKPFLNLDIAKIKYWEKRFWQKANKLVAVSEEEKRLMTRPDVVVVPNGVDLKKFPISNLPVRQAGFQFPISKGEKRILFIGDFRWMQNRDAVEWLLKEIWPKINLKFLASRRSGQISNLKLKLWIVGKNIPQSLKKWGNDSVLFDEDAPDETVLIYQKADLLLAPIRVGGGTSFKILEAMACGVLVVTTSLGIEGIEAENNQEILISNDVKGLADLTIDILQNKVIYEKIARNARKLIEKKYTWEVIVKGLERAYFSALR